MLSMVYRSKRKMGSETVNADRIFLFSIGQEKTQT